jgi:hypothetical protein
VVDLVLALSLAPPLVLHGPQVAAHLGTDPQLFVELAAQAVLQALPRLPMAARQKRVRLSLGLHDEHMIGLPDNGARKKMNRRHRQTDGSMAIAEHASHFHAVLSSTARLQTHFVAVPTM